MKTSLSFLLLLVLAAALLADAPPKFDPLPAPVCNNAVTSLKFRGRLHVFSFMGLGPKKTWDAITNAAYDLDVETGKWSEVIPVPGQTGRLAAGAAGLREHVFLFGGFLLDAQGDEVTVSDVSAYWPLTGHWSRAADIPVPVDDFVVGAYRDRYVYLVSGRSKTKTVPNVQVYDAEKNRWLEATPIPGSPVFGHSGALVDDTIVYVDGAYKNPTGDSPRYVASDQCWMGKIDHHDPAKIQWTKLPAHPGTARYRIAAGGSEKDQKIYFAGGTDNPYNYNGMGYDGKPSMPSPATFAFNLRTSKWETLSEQTPDPTMDHRGLVVLPESLLIVGGMDAQEHVSSRVSIVLKPKKQ